MSSFLQQITPENRAKRAQDQALHYIDTIPPVIVNGEDITQAARTALRAQIESAHKTTLKAIQDRRSQFIGGLFAFFVLVHKTKKKYEAAITEFESETRRIHHEALQAIEREVAQRISQEGAARLLNQQSTRLSHDARRVANQVYKTSIELDKGSNRLTQSQLMAHHHIQQQIWEKDDVEEFERNQNREVQTNPLEDMVRSAHQAARTPSPQGLSPPPRAARAFQQVEVQDSAEMAVPIRNRHRRQETFSTFGCVRSSGSSGHEGSASSSSASDSYQTATGLDEDDLEDINFQTVYNEFVAMYQDRPSVEL